MTPMDQPPAFPRSPWNPSYAPAVPARTPKGIPSCTPSLTSLPTKVPIRSFPPATGPSWNPRTTPQGCQTPTAQFPTRRHSHGHGVSRFIPGQPSGLFPTHGSPGTRQRRARCSRRDSHCCWLPGNGDSGRDGGSASGASGGVPGTGPSLSRGSRPGRGSMDGSRGWAPSSEPGRDG